MVGGNNFLQFFTNIFITNQYKKEKFQNLNYNIQLQQTENFFIIIYCMNTKNIELVSYNTLFGLNEFRLVQALEKYNEIPDTSYSVDYHGFCPTMKAFNKEIEKRFSGEFITRQRFGWVNLFADSRFHDYTTHKNSPNLNNNVLEPLKKVAQGEFDFCIVVLPGREGTELTSIDKWAISFPNFVRSLYTHNHLNKEEWDSLQYHFLCFNYPSYGCLLAMKANICIVSRKYIEYSQIDIDRSVYNSFGFLEEISSNENEGFIALDFLDVDETGITAFNVLLLKPYLSAQKGKFLVDTWELLKYSGLLGPNFDYLEKVFKDHKRGIRIDQNIFQAATMELPYFVIQYLAKVLQQNFVF